MIGRAARREERRRRIEDLFDDDAGVALDFLDVLELAWHDCYGEPTWSDEVLDDLLLLADGDLRALVRHGLLAVTDWRDLRVAAQARRG